MSPPDESSQAHAQFSFTGFAVDRVLFEHIPREAPGDGENLPPRIDYELEVGINASVNTDRSRGEVRLDVRIAPDVKWRPYRIEVSVLGQFALIAGSPEEFLQFCRMGVPPILFPYVREIVHRLTADGKHGILRLDPVNIQVLSAQAQWTETAQTANKPA